MADDGRGTSGFFIRAIVRFRRRGHWHDFEKVLGVGPFDRWDCLGYGGLVAKIFQRAAAGIAGAFILFSLRFCFWALLAGGVSAKRGKRIYANSSEHFGRG